MIFRKFSHDFRKNNRKNTKLLSSVAIFAIMKFDKNTDTFKSFIENLEIRRYQHKFSVIKKHTAFFIE